MMETRKKAKRWIVGKEAVVGLDDSLLYYYTPSLKLIAVYKNPVPSIYYPRLYGKFMVYEDTLFSLKTGKRYNVPRGLYPACGRDDTLFMKDKKKLYAYMEEDGRLILKREITSPVSFPKSPFIHPEFFVKKYTYYPGGSRADVYRRSGGTFYLYSRFHVKHTERWEEVRFIPPYFVVKKDTCLVLYTLEGEAVDSACGKWGCFGDSISCLYRENEAMFVVIDEGRLATVFLNVDIGGMASEKYATGRVIYIKNGEGKCMAYRFSFYFWEH